MQGSASLCVLTFVLLQHVLASPHENSTHGGMSAKEAATCGFDVDLLPYTLIAISGSTQELGGGSLSMACVWPCLQTQAHFEGP